jgi:hypothetical protein
MTYFSDFDTTEYMYDDYSMRKSILRNAEDIYLADSYETVPEDLFDDLTEDLY